MVRTYMSCINQNFLRNHWFSILRLIILSAYHCSMGWRNHMSNLLIKNFCVLSWSGLIFQIAFRPWAGAAVIEFDFRIHQEVSARKRNPSPLAMKLRLSCTNISAYEIGIWMISSFLVIEYLIVTMGNFCKIYFNILIVVAAVIVTIIFNYSNNLLYYQWPLLLTWFNFNPSMAK